MTALSIVVPCFNEEACLAPAARAAERAAQRARRRGLRDRAGQRRLARRQLADDAAAERGRPAPRRVNLSRNHGHQLALTAGLDLCRGEQILIIDADLQDPPELLGPCST
jgi:glycosyltransferase involved in cell wall biosynthesis